MSSGVPWPFITFVALVLAVVGFWLWALVDLLRRPDGEWNAAGQSKTTWVLVVAFLGWLGAVLYFFIARKALRRSNALPA